MALINTFDVAPEDQEAFFKYLRWGNRYVSSRIIAKERPLSRRGVEEVIDTSLLDQISALWRGLSGAQQTAWQSAGSWSGQTGYALFVQDTSYRIKNALVGVATPNDYHQYKVVHLNNAVADYLFSISQYHYNEYYIVRKVTGSQNMLEPVFVEEYVTFPFFIRFNMKSSLTLGDPSWYFRMRVSLEYYISGVQYYQDTDFVLPLVADWDYYEFEVPDPGGVYGVYTVTFYSWYTEGYIELDGVEFYHSSQNWAFDPNCDNMLIRYPQFPGIFIPANWQNNVNNSDVTMGSIYIE